MELCTHNLGYPRIGPNRELKRALESYWKGDSTLEALLQTAAELRRQAWTRQKAAGIRWIPTGDFSLYDHVLDTAALVGAVPSRFGSVGEEVSVDQFFAMARGLLEREHEHGSRGIPPMEMTKWFDTNYHYIVPELKPAQTFRLSSRKPFTEFLEARQSGFPAKPVLLGPISFLRLSKMEGNEDAASLLPALLPVYQEILRKFDELGCEWIQIDEPALVLDLSPSFQHALTVAYSGLRSSAPRLKLLLATYFGPLRDNLETVFSLPVDAVHWDATRGGAELDSVLAAVPTGMILSLGIVDGRNVWRNNFSESLRSIEQALAVLGRDRLWIAPSCSLLHVPVSLEGEKRLDPEFRSWLAFAYEKLHEVVDLARLAVQDPASLSTLEENRRIQDARRRSGRVHDPAVARRVAAVGPLDLQRTSPYPTRKKAQRSRNPLPLLPTTTIGSFPQTPEVRKARARWRTGGLTTEQYDSFLEGEIRRVIALQEDVDLDVLVHGEFERNDMVEYFGEQLAGFAFTEGGWVQSYGSRCTKPPIIFGDVSRPKPMTVRWSQFAQSLTKKPVKGMLTGPITILQWSFVRDDQPRSVTARQIALAIRDEVADLEKAGLSVIQIDEPALREGLPLRRADWPDYLTWSVEAFRLSSSIAADGTAIHTHMCYSEFNDIIDAIAALDADVISIESSRSNMELLRAFAHFRYPNEIGPGVWDIHSPRIPSVEEIAERIRRALAVLPASALWVNPDCGLKTRNLAEVVPSLRHMVEAAKRVRKELEAKRESTS
ncbi:5-methyltetrahydropteroyltriglutamate--homocysteine methyltransferase [Methylacidimicrobium cyclopophantes]|uniref:5-methyltetrahydropteroyltriglutamate--homocysteine methyltransferase n=1 Tax=Methylacidimicrobium cyclopophantes TaxID=1041766 RepID=A0A5E6M567_9BACT|nr:5-methyltetrahydropteroyltriglutamate--homocysteine S-methyltransferase [Methylacidimicrobium cyclopophantes]VVM04457.1 5-methyltetrahydropteroyltriglutamate--homocysteine methyltransferase [Methylacidimicrobium cyclopophantes]